MNRYKVVASFWLDDLEESVEMLLDEGWELYGPMSVSKKRFKSDPMHTKEPYFLQPMKKIIDELGVA